MTSQHVIAVPQADPSDKRVAGRNHAEVALNGIYEISKLLASPNRLEPTLSGVLALLSSFLDMRHGLIALLDADGKADIVVGSGWSEANAARYFERLPERAIGRIVVTKMPLVIPDISADPLFTQVDLSDLADLADLPDLAETDDRVASFIGVPIKQGDTVMGTLTIDRVRTRDRQIPYDADVRFLTMVANLVGQTLRLHKVVSQDRQRLLAEQARLAKETLPQPKRSRTTIEGIVGTSAALQAVVEKVRIIAQSNSTVMLRGETGTGKEMFANAIHNLSSRKAGPFVKLNCAALPESVLESELFGHEKGAFTGAINQHKGRFERANGGTLFLDEIGEISPFFQAKLLRVLQESEFERVGGTRSIKVDVRLVCATNRNLEDDVRRGTFRADLYYRIAVVPIFLPSLRERKEDIPLLADEFLRRFNHEHTSELTFSPSAVAIMRDCFFPGNVRELDNCVRHTASLTRNKTITEADFACQSGICLSAMLWKSRTEDFPHTEVVSSAPSTAGPAHPGPTLSPRPFEPPPPMPLARPQARMPAPPPPEQAAAEQSVSEQSFSEQSFSPGKIIPDDALDERARLIAAMETAGWVQAKAARILGLTARQIGYALRKHAIEMKKF